MRAYSPRRATAADDRPSLTIAYPSVWKTHDGLDTANAAQPVVHNLYDRIIRRNWLSRDMSMENQLLPGLATSWERVSDTEWHLKIRKGVRFHDGTPMTAEDVAFTVSPERTEMKPNAFIPTIKLTEAIDDETVRVVTKQPDPILLWRLATAVAYVVPKDYYTKMGAEGFGPESDRDRAIQMGGKGRRFAHPGSSRTTITGMAPFPFRKSPSARYARSRAGSPTC